MFLMQSQLEISQNLFVYDATHLNGRLDISGDLSLNINSLVVKQDFFSSDGVYMNFQLGLLLFLYFTS